MKKFLVLSLIFYILTILQNSFLVFFNVKGVALNFALILVIFFNLFDNPKNNTGFLSAVIGGFFLDVFSGGYIGLSILVLVIISILIQKVFKNYIRLAI